jgi:hypothetical protein
LHRCQLIEYVIGFFPFHWPVVVSSLPTVGVPVITGGVVAAEPRMTSAAGLGVRVMDLPS